MSTTLAPTSITISGYAAAVEGCGKLVAVSIEITDPKIIDKIKHGSVKNLSLHVDHDLKIHATKIKEETDE